MVTLRADPLCDEVLIQLIEPGNTYRVEITVDQAREFAALLTKAIDAADRWAPGKLVRWLGGH